MTDQPKNLKDAQDEIQKLEKATQDDRASLESVSRASKRCSAIIDRLSKNPGDAEKVLLTRLRRVHQGLIKRQGELRDKRKKEENVIRRLKKWVARHRKSKTGTVIMNDSINPPDIPAGPALCYTAGYWPTCKVVQNDPKWHPVVSCSINSGASGRIDDVEPGDYSNDESAQSDNPGKYTSVSNLVPLWNTIKGHGKDPTKFFYMTAHYDDHDHICDEHCGYGITPEIAKYIRGTQFTDHADGKNLDRSRVHLDIF